MNTGSIGKRLRAARESSGFTQEQVAAYLGVKRENISYIETGARAASTVMVRRMADLYGYRLSYLLDEAVKDEGPQVAVAFRVADLSADDLPVIAQVRRIASNLDSLYRLLGD